MSKLLILVGCPGAGKTHKAKSLIEKVHPQACYIFDVNNEYGEKYTQYYTLLDGEIDLFVEKIRGVKKGVILVEDATGFLPVNGRNNTFVKCLQGRRHTGNTFILLFHSVQDIPKYILRFANAVYLFKTNDLPEYVEKTFGNVRNRETDFYTAWKQVYDEAKDHEFFNTTPRPKGVSPPMVVFSLY